MMIARIALGVLLVTTAFAADVKITVHPALQGYKYLDPPGIDHPVITSATHSSQQLLEMLEITNYSSKAVTEVQYGWRIASAAKCGSTFPPKWGHVAQKINIAAGKSGTIAPPEIFTTNEYLHQLIDEADLANAHSVVVTLGIVKAIYADGTAWEDKDAGPKNMFDGGIAETVEACTKTTTPTSSIPKCGGKFKNAVWESNALDQCWPTPARGCTGRQIIAGDCPFEDCVIVGCGVDCSLTWTVCSGSFYPLNCNTISH